MAFQAQAAEKQSSLEVRCTGYFLAEAVNARRAGNAPSADANRKADMLAQAGKAEALMNAAMDKAFARGESNIQDDVKAAAQAYSRRDKQERLQELKECFSLLEK